MTREEFSFCRVRLVTRATGPWWVSVMGVGVLVMSFVGS